MPFFDEGGNVTEAAGRVIWEFRMTAGKGEVIDPYAPSNRAIKTASELAADALRIAQRARQILNSQAVWNRADNRQCPPNAKVISLYCALETATFEVTGSFDHRGTVMEDARAAIDEVAPHHPNYDHWLMGYNNDPSTTFADIQKLLRLTEERVAKRIRPITEDGSQWARVSVLAIHYTVVRETYLVGKEIFPGSEDAK